MPEVRPGALEVLAGRQPGLDHSLAFEVLDRQLGLLAKASGVLNLCLGEAIGPMLDGRFEALGYSRAQDYCVEQLGFCKRTAELLRKQAKQFDRHPIVRDAYLEARINESAARLLLNHLDSGGANPEELIGVAARCTVRALKEQLAAAGQGLGHAAAERDLADAAGEPMPAEGTWRTYHLPPAWAATWEMVVEHFRRMEDADLQPGEILELLAADFLAGKPVEWPVAGGGVEPVEAHAPRHGHGGLSAARNGQGTNWGSRSAIDWRKMLEEVSSCWKGLPEVVRVKVELDGKLAVPIPADPRELHAYLLDLVVCRRRLEVYMGRMLRTMADYSLARMADFASICHYSAERLGIGASTTMRLIARDRRLIRRQTVYEAIVAGRIGFTQADLILSLPCIAPDEKWVAWAETRTCRGLGDAANDLIAAARLAPDAIWKRGWHPPEKGECLAEVGAPLAGGRTGEAADGKGQSDVPVLPAEAAQSSVVALQEAVKLLPMFSPDGVGPRIFVPAEALPVIEAAEALASRLAGRPLPPEVALVAFMIGVEAQYTQFERKKAA
ncbi:MAG: hypothetical protein FJZ00_00695, partial [Candidatus Sericytochromatia bacterium]|nr:hypothetical protein [Candidatus Tanganyikabacteria bacterium]